MSGIGVWFVGARGNIATTAMVGARAVARDAVSTTGLVTERDPCTQLELPDLGSLSFGGHDIREGSVISAAREVAERNGVPDRETLAAVEDDLKDVDEHVRRGTALNCGAATDLADGELLEADRTVAEIVEQLRSDLRTFRRERDLDQVVVVNVASTEPTLDDPDEYASRADLEAAIEADDHDLSASVLYAYAALAEGCPYANFTPAAGSAVGGLRELAAEEDVPHMGNDGKTGESLVKTALGPMFAGRNLHVRSWEGHNILGNTDGQVLEDDENKEGKIQSKGDLLESILPELEHNRVRIDHTPSLNDWKTAWDYIHFEGFLDTQMKMQFTWEGSDSALAAPLALDLVRLLSHADEHGESGLQRHLASFFKAPIGVDEHDLSRQFDRLSEYVDRHRRHDQPTETEPITQD